MPSNIPSNPGNAKIVKQGHTYNDRFGDGPDQKVKGGRTVKDLSVKSK